MKKMFIAGAVCPQCQQVDKIFVYQEAGEDVAECKSCGHRRFRPKAGDAVDDGAAPAARSGAIPFVNLPE